MRIKEALSGERSPVSSEVAATVRQVLADHFLFGFPEEGERAVRESVASRYGLSVNQVQSIGAQLRIRADRSLAASGLTGVLGRDDAVAIARYFEVSGNQNLEVVANEISRDRGLDVAAVSALLIHLAGGKANPTSGGTAVHADTQPASTAPLTQPSEATPISVSDTAAHVDYDFPAKRAWREAWAEFLDRNLPKASRHRATVICLPSKVPSREINYYLKLGIRPENILAVEGDPSAYPEFLAGCARLGVKSHCGRLEDLLPTCTSRFNVVSYDFVGPYSERMGDIIADTPCASEASICINFLGRRERAESQELAGKHDAFDRHWRTFMDQLRAESIRTGTPGPRLTVPNAAAEFERLVAEEASKTEIGILRDKSIPGLLATTFGKARPESLGPARSLILNTELECPTTGERYEWPRKRMVMLMSAKNYFQGLAKAISSDAESAAAMASAMDWTLSSATQSLGHWVDVKRTRYRSSVSNAGSPFHCVMGHVHVPARDYQSISSTVQFLARLVLQRLRDDFRHATLGEVHHYRSGLSSGGLVVFEREGKDLLTIRESVLVRDIMIGANRNIENINSARRIAECPVVDL